MIFENFRTFSLSDNNSYKAGCPTELKLEANNRDLRIHTITN